MKRAAIIITDEPHVHRLLVDFTRPGITLPGSVLTLDTSEQLLADLHTLTTECLHGDLASVRDAAARVRDAIGGE